MRLVEMESVAFENYKSELKVLSAIRKLTNESKYPYLAQIVEETGLTRKTALTAVGELLRTGIIVAGNAHIESGRWVRTYIVAGEGAALAKKVLDACYIKLD